MADISLLPNSHWLHPAISALLKVAKTIKASEAAITVLNVLKAQAESEAESEDRNENRPASQTEQSTQSLLVFLWAVSKGYSKSVSLSDTPESEFIEEKCNSIPH